MHGSLSLLNQKLLIVNRTDQIKNTSLEQLFCSSENVISRC
jgi:hypothetical protein